MLRWSMLDEQVGQAVQHIVRLKAARHYDRQGSSCELVDDAEHVERPAIPRPVLDEVVGPHMVGSLRAQPHTRSIVEPQTAPFWLLLRHFQPLPPPDPPDPLDVHSPAFTDQPPADPRIAVAAVPAGQPLDGGRQRGLIVADPRPTTLRRARLTDNPAGP